MIDLRTVLPGSTIRIPFATFGKTNGESITMTNFAAADILIYKDGSTTERASTSGYTATTDFDGKTGRHLLVIDLSDNTTADFFAAGSEYLVAIDSVTVDSQTVGTWVARFRIGYPDAVHDTTIATLNSQTSFTLTAGPADDNALVGCIALIHDAASAVQRAIGVVSAYTGSTKTVTLAADPAVFTMAAKDNISFFVPSNTKFVGGTVQTARDIGASVLLSSGTGTGQVSLTSGILKVDLDTIKTNPVVNGGTFTFPTNATGASTTNITAGTITTVGTVNALAADSVNASALAASAVTEIQSGLATASALATVQADADDIQTRLPAALGANGNMKADVRDFSGTAGTFSGGRPEVLLGASQNATTFASLTVTGRLQVSDGIDVSCSTANRHAFKMVANGSGQGIRIEGGSGGGVPVYITSAGGFPSELVLISSANATNGITVEAGAGAGLRIQGGSLAAHFISGSNSATEVIRLESGGSGDTDGFGFIPSGTGVAIRGTIDGAITNSGLAPSSTALSTAQWTNTRAGYLDKLANLPSDPADASDIAAALATLTSHGDSTWATATGFAVAGDAMALTSTERNNVAAVTLRRSAANIEAAAVGDTLTKNSLYGFLQQAQYSNATDNAGFLTIKKTTGVELGRLTLATATADPITGIAP